MEQKDNRERNPGRCNELRETDRDLRKEIREVANNRRRWMSKLESLREARARKQQRFESLKVSAAASTGASALPGPIGMAAGVVSAGDLAALSALEAQINQLSRQITQTEYQFEPLDQRQQQLERSLSQNARQMQSLNCVLL